jgi:hypothetical protein
MTNVKGIDHDLIGSVWRFPDRTIISVPDPDAVRQGFLIF